jgi:hypothetical protein
MAYIGSPCSCMNNLTLDENKCVVKQLFTMAGFLRRVFAGEVEDRSSGSLTVIHFSVKLF